MLVLLDEFQRLYNGQSLPEPSGTQELPEWPTESQCREIDLGFWRSRLQGCPTTVAWPVRKPVTHRTLAGSAREFILPKPLSRRLKELARREQVSLNVLMLAAFQLLLHRFSSQDNLMVGVPVSLRRRQDTDRIVGFHIASLPVRSRYQPWLSFSEFLRNTRQEFLTAMDHAATPFDQIVRAVNPPRTTSNPLFQCMLVMREPLPKLHLQDGTVMEPCVAHLGASKFDLTMFVTSAGGSMPCGIEYSTALFTEETIEQLQNQWIQLLTSISAKPAAALKQLKRLAEREHTQGPASDGSSRHGPRGNDRVHEVIDRHAPSGGSGSAVVDRHLSLTRQQLKAESDRLAMRLSAAGVMSGECVAVCVPRSVELVVTILGILKAGAAYVPLDPAQPAQRRRYVLEDCGARHAVVQAETADVLSDFKGSLICIDEPLQDDATVSAETDITKTDFSERVSLSANSGDTLAYVMYTSGSTGQPKGVEITHRNLLLSTLARSEYYEHFPKRFLLLSSFAFDSSVAGIFWTLCSGGTLILPPPELEHDVLALGNAIEQHGITHSLCLPAIYELLLDHVPVAQLASLQTMIVAGESCSPRLVQKHFQHLPDTELYNEYGPTEGTVWSTAHRLQAADGEAPTVPIGRAIGHTQVFLLDQHRQPVPSGVPGEIFLGGDKLARGYRNRPDLTAAAFIANPFSSNPASRLYRTGDLAKQQPDGALVFLGRIDHQIKINGHRVEAEEIETALTRHPSVRAAVVGLTAAPSSTTSGTDVASLCAGLKSLPDQQAELLLQRAEAIAAQEEPMPGGSSGFVVCHQDSRVKVSLQLPSEDSITTPRAGQRKWLLDQALQETVSDIQHLQQIAPRFVPGSDQPHLPRDIREEKLSDQEIMEDWQYPLMKAMAVSLRI
ncbi:MAG: amino acid adenylation domain-containing protein [Fuerstiella sp.]